MGVFSSSTGCPVKPANAAGKGMPITGSLTFHHLITIIAWVCFGISVLLWVGLTVPHLRRYRAPNEQRQIFRIVSTPPVFAIVAVISIHAYDAALYLAPLSNLYEAYALASLFLLYVQYVAPDAFSRNEFFHNLEYKSKKGEIIAGGSLRWFIITWRIVFLYVVIYTILIIIQEITQATGVYCSTSSKLRFAHIWLQALELISTIVAIVAMVRFQRRLKGYMTGRQALPKLVMFKLFVIITTLQHFVFSILQSRVSGSSKVTYEDITVGIPALLICIEAAIFMVAFYFIFNAKAYGQSKGEVGPSSGTVRALLDAMNPTDLLRGIRQAFASFRGRK